MILEDSAIRFNAWILLKYEFYISALYNQDDSLVISPYFFRPFSLNAISALETHQFPMKKKINSKLVNIDVNEMYKNSF